MRKVNMISISYIYVWYRVCVFGIKKENGIDTDDQLFTVHYKMMHKYLNYVSVRTTSLNWDVI